MDLNFKTFGSGPPVIILHGLFGTLDNWQTVARQLSENFTVFILDLRNHGRSPHAPQHDYPAMAEDLRAFMEHHWMYKAHIIGHSMGGKAAMYFALHHPDWVEKLVVVDIAPKKYPRGHDTILKALLSVDLAQARERSDVETTLSTYIDDPGVRLFLMKNLSRKPEGGFEWKMNLPVLNDQYENILVEMTTDAPFENPALFVRGERSDYVLEEDLPLIKKLFPSATLVTVPDAGHWVHAEQPAVLLKILHGFFQ